MTTMNEENPIVETLRKESYRFRSLEKTHLELEASLDGMNKRRILSAEDELQKKKAQKEKLADKDRKEQMIRDASLTSEAKVRVG